jgi:uncharacterized protein (DUF433 family)
MTMLEMFPVEELLHEYDLTIENMQAVFTYAARQMELDRQ